MGTSTISYKNRRFPPQIIARAVWLYFRFPLSLRLVEEILLERGIIVSYEPSGDGAANSARLTQSRHAERNRCERISGIWTRW
jgi:transposase-like protein